MQTSSNTPNLPDTPELREKMAEIIANVCRCERQPLLDDEPFSAVITQFDSLAILEVMLEVETIYHIQTDDMLPLDPEKGAQDILSTFPENLSALVVYMREVAARVQEREQAGAGQSRPLRRQGRTAHDDEP